MEKNYKETLNLPYTDMPMRAGLAKREPEVLDSWEKQEIYKKIIEKNKDNKSYILHDGPPYPNGNIHLGHALNKILKDIIIKYKNMKGFYTPYTPGWDCHGLPIEVQLLKDLKKQKLEHKKSDVTWFRDKCKEYALGYVDTQKEQFKKLGIFGDWDNPYLTLDPEYEASVIEQFGDLANNGYVYRGRKPIHWCMSCETALAEAEIEYDDHKSPSITFKFVVKENDKDLKEITTDGKTSILVWTTTPWTLPANVAAAMHPRFDYDVVLNKATGERYIVVKELVEQVMSMIDVDDYEVLKTYKGESLEGLKYQHPFIDRVSPVVNAEYVSNEDGTGTVRIAPGHGHDDYIVGLNKDLPMIMPVDHEGKLTDEAPEWVSGMKVFDANKIITEKMHENGTLLKLQFIKHSYPHCWRCKSPVIFRATEQWFIAMDDKFGKEAAKGESIRDKALEAIQDTHWIPAWGENRINGMIAQRPDWCVSRQRSWGIPIPAIYCDCGEVLMTGEFNKAIVSFVKENGTGGWFAKEASEIIPEELKCPKCSGRNFTKEKDIMDVWMESGGSHRAVLESSKHPGLSWPADLYLEGSDQHRGWFHSSMLMSVGARDRAPYNAVLTHGFTVDEKGRKMSKSLGNVVDPIKVMKQSGADIIRLWVSSADFRNDLSVSDKIMKQVQEAFTKIRNTQRFLLSNLFDFDIQKDAVEYDKLDEIDKWVLAKLAELVERVSKGYENFELHHVYHGVYNFCVVTLSQQYMDIKKDILYCGGKDSNIRRSSQTVMYQILETIAKLMAPVTAYTSEEVWGYLDQKDSVHLADFPQVNEQWKNVELINKWSQMFELRSKVNAELEKARTDKVIGSSLDAKIVINTSSDLSYADLSHFFIVSDTEVVKGDVEEVSVEKAIGEKCDRCWKWSDLKSGLCPRCYEVVEG